MQVRKLQGRDLILFTRYGRLYEAVAFSTSCSLTVNQEAIETMSRTGWDWRSHIPGKKDWAVTASGIIAVKEINTRDLLDLLGKTVSVRFASVPPHREEEEDFRPDGHHTRTGDAVVTSIEETGELDGMATYSISLTGTGELVNGGAPISGAMWDDAELWDDTQLWQD